MWLWTHVRMHFIPKLKLSEIELHRAEKKKKSVDERLEVSIFSPFPASCTQLATENCRRSRAICSDSSGTAQRGGGETVCHLYNRSRLPTVSKEQLQHTPKTQTHTHIHTHAYEWHNFKTQLPFFLQHNDLYEFISVEKKKTYTKLTVFYI